LREVILLIYAFTIIAVHTNYLQTSPSSYSYFLFLKVVKMAKLYTHTVSLLINRAEGGSLGWASSASRLQVTLKPYINKQ